MKRYRRIDTERASLSDSEIAQLKPPFSALTERMQSGPSITPKPPVRHLVTAIIGAAVVIALVVFYYLFLAVGTSDNNDESSLQLAEDLTERRIDPPDPARIDYEYFKVSADNSAVFTTRKGTRISVPAKAFANADGTPFTGSADLRFAEFHDVVEIFLSGVPMSYDSAGVNYTFLSAGMFDIMAFSGGNSLILADGKEIAVDLVSNDPKTHNIYYYDTAANSWQYLYTEKSDNIVPNDGRDDTRRPADTRKRVATEAAGELLAEGGLSMEQERFAEASPERRFKRRDKNNFAFKIDFDEKSFPELSGVSDLMFEITDNSADKKYLRGTWDSIALRKDSEKGYLISLFRLKSSYTFKAQPVLNAAEYDAVVQSYREEAVQREHKSLERRRNAVVQRAATERLDANMRNWAYSRNVNVINLGTWNFDIPVPKPENAAALIAGFADDEGKAIYPKSIFVAQKGVNILWNYTPSQRPNYSRSKENIMWFILPDGNYAIITDDKLRSKEKIIVPAIVDVDHALTEIKKYI